MTEWLALSRILRSSWMIDRPTLEIIGARHLMFEKRIIPFIPKNVIMSSDPAMSMMTASVSVSSFISMVRQSFRENNPGFISYLESFGLNSAEIDYCVLLTLGFKGCEIGFLTNDSSHYNRSTAIRHKLGLSVSDTNLGIHLKGIFASE